MKKLVVITVAMILTFFLHTACSGIKSLNNDSNTVQPDVNIIQDEAAPTPTPSPTPTPTPVSASIVDPTTEEWTYGINQWNGTLYRTKGGFDESVGLAGSVNSYIIIDDWLYFTSNSDGDFIGELHSLFKMRLDGSERVKICDDVYRLSDHHLVDGWMYFESENGDLYRVRLNGSSERDRVGSNTIARFYTDGEWIVFHNRDDDLRLYKMRIGSEDEFIKINISLGFVNEVYNGWIYYTDDNSLYKVRIDETDKMLIVDGENLGYIMTVDGEWVYYQDGGSFFKIKTDGSDKQNITEGEFLEKRKPSVHWS